MEESFGHYEDLSLLGKGSMGAVYRGHDPDHNRPVAIKVLAPQGAVGRVQRDDLLERFTREAQAYEELAHPNIVALYDVGVTEDNCPYLVMELVEGISLDARLKADGVFSPGVVARIGDQIARALQHAHEAGFIHRDVKPANIILARDGTAKLMDFGIARTSISSLTAEGAFIGSLLFASPEQIAARPLDGRSDLFSLGVTLYVLLIGRNPFARKTLQETTDAIEKFEPQPPSYMRVELSRQWDAVIGKALVKDSDGRFQKAIEMAAVLSDLAEEADSAITVGGSEPSYDLVVVRGPEKGRRFPMKSTMTIGRREGEVVLNDARISGKHCIVEIHDDRIRVRDLKSLNGTWVDGEKIDTAELQVRQKLYLGPHTVVRVVPRAAAAESADTGTAGTDHPGGGTAIMPGAIDYVLVIEEGPRQGTRLVLGSSLLLSRSQGKGQLDDPTVSSKHAVVEVRDGKVFVRDLGSRNGTYIGKQRIEERQLEPGQKLRIGSSVLVLHRAESV